MNHDAFASRLLRGIFGPLSLLVSVGVALCAFAPAARAQDGAEVWVGGQAHDLFGLRPEGGTADIVLEVDSPNYRFMHALGSPRFNAVVTLNSARRTNTGAIGMVWDHRIFGPIYGSVDLGVALTDGVTDPPSGPAGDYDQAHRLLLGSKVLFRGATGLDWRIGQHWALGAEFFHLSNASLLGTHHYNRGLNDAGLRLGYRF